MENEKLIKAIAAALASGKDAASIVNQVRAVVREPDLFDEIAAAFPAEWPALSSEWRALGAKTWETVLSRPRAWKILAAYAAKSGISF